MTAFDKAWSLVKTRGFDIRDHEDEGMYSFVGDQESGPSTGYTAPHHQGSHNEYIPLDEDGEPLSMEPMPWASAKAMLDAYEEETGIPCNSLTQIAPVEGGLADQISMAQLRRDFDEGDNECPDCDGLGQPLPKGADREDYSRCGNCKGYFMDDRGGRFQ